MLNGISAFISPAKTFIFLIYLNLLAHLVQGEEENTRAVRALSDVFILSMRLMTVLNYNFASLVYFKLLCQKSFPLRFCSVANYLILDVKEKKCVSIGLIKIYQQC